MYKLEKKTFDNWAFYVSVLGLCNVIFAWWLIVALHHICIGKSGEAEFMPHKGYVVSGCARMGKLDVHIRDILLV